MKTQNLVLGAIVIGGISAVAGSAQAGTSVTNTYSTRNVRNGVGNLTVKQVDRYSGYQVNTSDSIKVETYGGTRNTSIANFNGYNLTGTAISTNEVVVDPVAIITVASQYERLNVSGYTVIDLTESYNFTEKVNTHSVSSDFN